MKHAFKDNKRVEIAEPASPFFVFEFGKCMIFSTHGDKVKPKNCQGMVANYYPEVWGRTEHRYAIFGHFHHEFKEEINGLMIEIHNTLASSDAWHSASGYRSKRNAKLIVLDKEEGEVERYTFNLSRKMLTSMK
jgi:predicted phosphodiesterase